MLFLGARNAPVETVALGEKLRSRPLAALCPGLSENEPPLKGDCLSLRLLLRGRRYEGLGGLGSGGSGAPAQLSAGMSGRKLA